jgi:hypothetical protein
MKLLPGVDPGFAERGGERREIFWGISCEKSRFYAKKSYFFHFGGGGVRPSPWLLYCLINNEDGLLLTCSN